MDGRCLIRNTGLLIPFPSSGALLVAFAMCTTGAPALQLGSVFIKQKDKDHNHKQGVTSVVVNGKEKTLRTSRIEYSVKIMKLKVRWGTGHSSTSARGNFGSYPANQVSKSR
jgi:hypothetical protein